MTFRDLGQAVSIELSYEEAELLLCFLHEAELDQDYAEKNASVERAGRELFEALDEYTNT